jgi:SAM-dependent methyltransferase
MLRAMNASSTALRPPSVHRLPAARLVDRLAELRAIVRAKSVIDLGFVDEGQVGSKRSQGTWLHEVVASEARNVVGVDADAAGVAHARELGFAAHVADVEDVDSLAALELDPADIVLAGELLEHLDRPGAFLEAVKQLVAPGGALVLTTPNGHALTNVLGGLAGRELVNPDHVAWFSWRTLTTLLGRHGWYIDAVSYYTFPPVQTGARAPRLLFNAYQVVLRPLFALRPNLADGLIVVAKLT